MKTNRVLVLLLVVALGMTPLLSAHRSGARAESNAAGTPIEAQGGFSAAHANWLMERADHVAGRPTTSAEAMRSTAQWTVMVYMAADNDLERFALSDLNEMEVVGSTEGVNIVVQLDRAKGYDTSDGDWTETRRFFVTRDRRLTQLASEQVGRSGQEVNTGDPAVLTDFATWAMTTYPAEHYALIIWDHGGSWLGVATDNSANNDDLILPDLDQALAEITAATGREQLDLVGFDACLMGAFEVYQTISPYALYGVGSAELIPGNGWDYLGALDALAADPTMSGDALGRAIVDNFINFYTTVVTQYPVFNLAVVDLTQADRVIKALNTLNRAVSSAPNSATDAIVSARSSTPEYGAFNDPQYADVWAAADLIQFLIRLRDTAEVDGLSSAASDAAEAARALLIYYRSSTDPDAAPTSANSGVSIYFPQDASMFLQTRQAERYSVETPAGIAQWNALLTTLFNTALQTLSGARPGGSITGITGGSGGALISMDPNLSALSRAALVVLLHVGGGQRIVVDYSQVTGVNANSTTWNGRVPYLTNGLSQLPVLVLRSTSGPALGIVNGQVITADGEVVRAQLVFDLNTNQMISAWGLRPTSGSLMPAELVLEMGDFFQPSWVTVSAANRLVSIPALIQLAVVDTPFRLVWKNAPAGSYEFKLLLNDAAGNASQSSVPAAVSGEDDEFEVMTFDPDAEDMDGDGIINDDDNCPVFPNQDQADTDEDGVGDACDIFDDRDLDEDGVPRGSDNCIGLYNPDQADSDGDGKGDACDSLGDSDGDGITDALDNCPATANTYQFDADHDGLGDACDPIYNPGGDPFAGLMGGDPGGTPPESDQDGDGVFDTADNCPLTANPDQLDTDADGVGDACEAGIPVLDSDGDGIDDPLDNCPQAANPDQADWNANGIGDACDISGNAIPAPDADVDGIPDLGDNCPSVFNPEQYDTDMDGLGDECDSDVDGDGVEDSGDNCPWDANPDQMDSDEDGLGDACDDDADSDGFPNDSDNCPFDYNSDQADFNSNGVGDVCEDTDADQIYDAWDNCPAAWNYDQMDSDEDGLGDACDDDWDDDGVLNGGDNCPFDYNTNQADFNQNGVGDVCEDTDADQMFDAWDNCPTVWNSGQEDGDYDGIGDACDDSDGDGVVDATDNCPSIPNSDQTDSDGDGPGDACDPLLADLWVTVTASNPNPVHGEVVTFTMTITNLGPNVAEAGTYGTGWAGVLCSGTGSGPTAMGSLPTLNPGASFSGVIASFTAGVYCSGNAQASAGLSSPTDPNGGNNSSSASFSYTPQADLQVTFNNPVVTCSGEMITYTATLTNLGPDDVATFDYGIDSTIVYCGGAAMGPAALGSGGPLAAGASQTWDVASFSNLGVLGGACGGSANFYITGASIGDPNGGNNSGSRSFSCPQP